MLIDTGGQQGASSREPETAQAIRQGDSPTTFGHRAAAPIDAAITDATASANTDPAAAAGTGSGASVTSSAVNNPRTASAREENRRNHPRTVAPGRPNRSATRRHPNPAALSASPAPTTSTASARRTSTETGNST